LRSSSPSPRWQELPSPIEKGKRLARSVQEFVSRKKVKTLLLQPLPHVPSSCDQRCARSLAIYFVTGRNPRNSITRKKGRLPRTRVCANPVTPSSTRTRNSLGPPGPLDPPASFFIATVKPVAVMRSEDAYNVIAPTERRIYWKSLDVLGIHCGAVRMLPLYTAFPYLLVGEAPWTTDNKQLTLLVVVPMLAIHSTAQGPHAPLRRYRSRVKR
jgi:hypothetical protein